MSQSNYPLRHEFFPSKVPDFVDYCRKLGLGRRAPDRPQNYQNLSNNHFGNVIAKRHIYETQFIQHNAK